MTQHNERLPQRGSSAEIIGRQSMYWPSTRRRPVAGCARHSRACSRESTKVRPLGGGKKEPEGANACWQNSCWGEGKHGRVESGPCARREMKGFTARIMYHKCGLSRFIGHLDTARVLRRAVRRAGIEGVYSQGFSPRLKLSYSDPLPLGVTSQCEFFDIKLAGSPSRGESQADAMRRNLQSHLPEGFLVERVDFLEGNASSLQKAYWAAAYEIELPRDCPVDREHVETFTMKQQSSRPSSDEADEAGADRPSRVVRASWKENDNGDPVFSVVLRQDIPGKGGLKKAISDILGISREILDRCRIHKKRVYGNGEEV